MGAEGPLDTGTLPAKAKGAMVPDWRHAVRHVTMGSAALCALAAAALAIASAVSSDVSFLFAAAAMVPGTAVAALRIRFFSGAIEGLVRKDPKHGGVKDGMLYTLTLFLTVASLFAAYLLATPAFFGFLAGVLAVPAAMTLLALIYAFMALVLKRPVF